MQKCIIDRWSVGRCCVLPKAAHTFIFYHPPTSPLTHTLGSAVRALTYNHTESEDGEEPEKSRYSLFVHRGTDDEDDYCLLSRGTPLRQIIDMVCLAMLAFGDGYTLYGFMPCVVRCVHVGGWVVGGSPVIC